MTHVIMSGPLRPLTEIERAAARARLDLDGSARSLAHTFNLFEPLQSQRELRQQALSGGWMLLSEAAREIGVIDSETAKFRLRDFREEESYGVTLYLSEDVSRVAERLRLGRLPRV